MILGSFGTFSDLIFPIWKMGIKIVLAPDGGGLV